MHLEKDNDNTNSPDYNPNDTNIWIHYSFKPNKYGLKNLVIEYASGIIQGIKEYSISGHSEI